MDRRFAVTALAVLLVTAGSIVMANRMEPQPEAAALHETVSGIGRQPSGPEETPEESEPEYMYMIKEYEGRVAVFLASGQGEPVTVFDTLVKYLPDYDRALLEEGIPVKDYQELVDRVEDYIS